MRFAGFPISIVNEHQNCAEGPFLTGCIIQPANEEREMLIAKELKMVLGGLWLWLGLVVARPRINSAREFWSLTPGRTDKGRCSLWGGGGGPF